MCFHGPGTPAKNAALLPDPSMFDFQRIRLSRDISSGSLLAASIFPDILNGFLFFLQIFSREQ
jgi:hypothetical protein